jgi:hypothetical protein
MTVFIEDSVYKSSRARGGTMDFQVNDQTYFVSVGEDQEDWHVFVSTPNGARSIPVYNDESEIDPDDAPVVVEDKRRRKIVN